LEKGDHPKNLQAFFSDLFKKGLDLSQKQQEDGRK